MQSTNHPSFLSLGREEIFLNEPLSSDDEDLYFLACAIHPQDTFPLLSISLLISTLHPLPLVPLLHSGVHTHLQRAHTPLATGHLCQSHLLRPQHGHRNTEKKKPSLCPWLCTRGNTTVFCGERTGSNKHVQCHLAIRAPLVLFKTTQHFFIVYLANVPASFWCHFLTLVSRATLCLPHPHSRP